MLPQIPIARLIKWEGKGGEKEGRRNRRTGKRGVRQIGREGRAVRGMALSFSF